MLRPFITCSQLTAPPSSLLLPSTCALPSEASPFLPVGVCHAHSITQICPHAVRPFLLQGPAQVSSPSQSLHQGHWVQYLREKTRSKAVWIQILALPFQLCMTLNKLLNLSVPQVPPLENGDEQGSQGYCED